MSNEQQRWVKILPSAVESNYNWQERYIGSVWLVDKEEDGDFLVRICLPSNEFSYEPFPIEPEHVQEVYVYDEPRVVSEVYVGSAAPQPTAKPMMVRVVKADENDWYCDKIGQEFKVLNDCGFYFYVLCNDELNTTYLIKSENCEVVKPEPEKMSDEQSAFLQRIAELEKRVAQLEEQQQRYSQQTAPQQESNIDKAKRLYPKGTKFKCAFRNDECKSTGEIYEGGDGDIWVFGTNSWVYYNGKWAEVMQPKQWRLKVDVPEWGLKKGDESESVRTDGIAVFNSVTWIPTSIMPYIADPVGEDGT